MSRLTLRNAWPETGLLLATAAAVFLADRITKAWVVANVEIGEQIPVLGDLVQIWHTENDGAAFGLLPGGATIFALVGIATVIVVIWVHLTGRLQGALPALLLGMVLGGTMGNLVDRLLNGKVVDWVSVGIGALRWPTFNVADASMFCGIVALLVYLSVLDRRTAAHTA
jgi:signal peptidase II